MTEGEERDLVLAEARRWLNTPYHHRACIRGVGVDCAQLPIGVWSGAGLIAKFDTGEYPSDWHMHREEERYMGIVERFAAEIEPAEAQAADLILFKYGRAFSHGAVILTVGPPTVLIHAARHAGAVVMADLEAETQFERRERRYFSFWKKRDG